MAKLSDINIQPVYDTDDNVRKFYIDTLSVATTYKRVSAYFNNGIFKYISTGIENLINNTGHMYLILSSEVDAQTYEQLKSGYNLKENQNVIIQNFFTTNRADFTKISSDISILSFLIAIGRLDVKIAIKSTGILHDKYGLIEDSDGNILLFSGSNNETEAAIQYNHESFETTYNWDNPSNNELSKIRIRSREFEELWENRKDNFVVLEVPEAIKEDLINSIEYDEIKKVTKDTRFIRVGIDSENTLKVKSNFNNSDIVSNYNFKNVRSFSKILTKNALSIIGLDQIKDISYCLGVLQKISTSLKARLVYDGELNDFLNQKILDMSALSIIGSEIKEELYLDSCDEFHSFSTKTNSLVKRELRFAQLMSAYHVFKIKRALNFSVPGSGKTASVIGSFLYLNSLQVTNPNHMERLLVFGPINCFKSWKDEFVTIAKEFNPNEIIDIKQMDDLAAKATILRWDFKKAKLVLINFEAITSLENVLIDLVDKSTMVVLDEIHRIKRLESEKYYSCKRIISKTQYRLALTGTPLPNGYADLYNIFDLIYDEYAKSYFGMHIDDLVNSDKVFESDGLENERLNSLIFPFYIRVTKNDLQIPPAQADNIVVVDTSEDEKKNYRQILSNSVSPFDSAIRLMQLGCIPNKAIKKYDKPYSVDTFQDENIQKQEQLSSTIFLHTSKIDKLFELIERRPRKAIVWCLFIDTINIVSELLLEKGYRVKTIYGATPIEDRNEIIDQFNNSNDVEIIVTNPATLAESVSLHKQCHNAYYLEFDYNLAQYLQSRDRIHRLGLPEGTETNYYILINNYGDLNLSIDQRIYDRLKKKEIRMINAIEKGAFFYTEKQEAAEYAKLVSDIKEGAGL